MKKKNWKGIKHKMVHMGMFDFSVCVVVGDYKVACEYTSWKLEDKDTDLIDFDKDYAPLGRCFFRSGYVPIVWIPRKPKTAREHGTYAHECIHAVFHLFDWAGLKITHETEEVMAHAVSYLVANGL